LKVSFPEHWSDGVLKKDIKPLAITPTLQHSNIPKIIEIGHAQDRLPFLGSWIRKKIWVDPSLGF
jgi:hypothetical protein